MQHIHKRNKNFNRRLAGTLSALLLVPFWGLPAYAESLQEAITLTLQNHPALKASEATVNAATEGIHVRESAYLPEVSLNAELNIDNYTRDVGSLSLKGRQASLGATQLIYDGGITPGRVSQAKAEKQAQSHEWVSAQNQMVLTATRAYLGVMRDRELLGAAERNMAFHKESAQKLLEIARIDTGKAFDLTQVRAREAQAKDYLEARKAALDASTGIYREVVGQAPSELSAPTVPNWPELSNLDEALNAGQKMHPAVQAAGDRVEAQKGAQMESWGGLTPRFDAVARYVRGVDLQSLAGQNDEAYAGVRGSYVFPLGMGTISQVRGAELLVESATQKASAARRDVREAIRVAYAQREGLNRTVPLATQHFKQVSQVLEGFKNQYKLGRRSMLEVLIIQDEVYNSESRKIQLKYEGLLSQFNLAAQAGLLIGKYGEQPQTPPPQPPAAPTP